MLKPLFLLAIAGFGGFMVHRLGVLNKFSNNAYFHVTLGKAPDIIDLNLLDFGKLRLWIDLEVVNPSNQTIISGHPYIQMLTDNNVQIAVSTPVNRTHELQTGRNFIRDIEVRVPIKTLLEQIGATSVIAQVVDIIASDDTLLQKITKIYTAVVGAMSGKTFKFKSTVRFDGISVSQTENIQFE